MRFLFVIVMLVSLHSSAQTAQKQDSVALFERGIRNVNKCTPWHHFQCVYITGVEVYKDGSEGKSTRHWWRMSYIGQACTAEHGTTFGQIFEGFFAIPHYIGITIGNGIGYMVYVVRGSPEKIKARKLKRKQKQLLREAERSL